MQPFTPGAKKLFAHSGHRTTNTYGLCLPSCMHCVLLYYLPFLLYCWPIFMKTTSLGTICAFGRILHLVFGDVAGAVICSVICKSFLAMKIIFIEIVLCLYALSSQISLIIAYILYWVCLDKKILMSSGSIVSIVFYYNGFTKVIFYDFGFTRFFWVLCYRDLRTLCSNVKKSANSNIPKAFALGLYCYLSPFEKYFMNSKNINFFYISNVKEIKIWHRYIIHNCLWWAKKRLRTCFFALTKSELNYKKTCYKKT